MMPQGIAEFNYKNDKSENNQTALAGLPLFIDLLAKMNFSTIVKEHLQFRTKSNCWSDVDQILSMMFLNIAGGDCVDDIEILNADRGFSRLINQLKIK